MAALWSRSWLLNWAAKISFTSFAREDVTVWDVTVAGGDASCEMMGSSGTPSGVVASKEDSEEDGLNEDGMDFAAAKFVGAMGAAEEEIVILETGAGGGSTEAMMQMELASETS